MLFYVSDDSYRYRIEVPHDCEVKLNRGGYDYLIVFDPEQPEFPFWLFDHILIEAARSGEFGLKLLSRERL